MLGIIRLMKLLLTSLFLLAHLSIQSQSLGEKEVVDATSKRSIEIYENQYPQYIKGGEFNNALNDSTGTREKTKEYYMTLGQSRLKKAKVLGFTSLVALGAGVLAVSTSRPCEDFICDSQTGYGLIAMYIVFPLAGTVGTIYYVLGHNALWEAEQFGFMESGLETGLKYVQQSTQLNLGLVQNGIGVTLRF